MNKNIPELMLFYVFITFTVLVVSWAILLVTVAGIAEQRHGDSKRQMLNEACQEIGYEEHISSFGVEGNCKKPGVMQRVIRECEYTKTLISKPLSCEVYIQQ